MRGISNRIGTGLAALALFALLGIAGARAGALEDQFFVTAKGSTKTVDHAAWTRLLKTYVETGEDGLNRVAYARVTGADKDALKAYIRRLEATNPRQLDRPEQIAFWANLYNAKTIDIVLDKYPVRSIKEISLGGGLLAAVTGGPWKAKVLKVNGIELSLDDIEHGIMRPYFKDPRIHYAVNCASVGCPNLMVEAFVGRDIERQLDQGARAFINSPRGFKVENGAIKASSIYTWFKSDFGGGEEGVLAHAAKYAEPELRDQLNNIAKIKGYDYDWSLNEAGKK